MAAGRGPRHSSLCRLALLLARAALDAPPASAGVAAAGAGVSIQSNAFQPTVVTVTAGSAVTWTNRDGTVHTTTDDGGTWDSGGLGFGQSFAHTFTQTGSFTYTCRIHPDMTGRVDMIPALPPGTVLIEGFAFDPETITIAADSTITWTNRVDTPHSTNGNGGLWASPILRQGQSYSRWFPTPGAYDYICGLHPEMKGTIQVTGSATPSPSPTPTVTPAWTLHLPLLARGRQAGW